jgi:hypothetical protein
MEALIYGALIECDQEDGLHGTDLSRSGVRCHGHAGGVRKRRMGLSRIVAGVAAVSGAPQRRAGETRRCVTTGGIKVNLRKWERRRLSFGKGAVAICCEK